MNFYGRSLNFYSRYKNSFTIAPKLLTMALLAPTLISKIQFQALIVLAFAASLCDAQFFGGLLSTSSSNLQSNVAVSQRRASTSEDEAFANLANTFTALDNSFVNVVTIGGNARRQGRQDRGGVQGGVDFSGCVTDPTTGFCCVDKTESVTTLKKDPILECTHKNVEKCHYTYVTQFEAAQEEVCEENFEKICQITFKQQALNETVKKCYRPLEKICNGQGEEECRTVYESSCTTKYVEKQPGKFVGDTSCEKLPVEICGAGCVTQEGAEECHDKVVTSLLDVPEEVCDLNPQKTCRFQTKLVPKLKPEHECTIIPQEICNLKFSNPEQVEKPLQTKWCLDPAAPTPGETYDEREALGSPITGRNNRR